MTSNLSDLLTSLMPQPRLHYPLITHVPIQNAISGTTLACTQLAVMSFDHSNQTVKVDPRKGKYLSVCMMFRGDMKPTEINTSIAFIQREHTLPLTQNMNSPLFKVSNVKTLKNKNKTGEARLNTFYTSCFVSYFSLVYVINLWPLCQAVALKHTPEL